MAKKNSRKFKFKILRIFILISLVPLLIISISSIFLLIKTRQQNIAELQNLAISVAEERVEKFLDNKIESMNLVLNIEDLENLSDDQYNQVIQTYDYLIDNINAVVGDVIEISFTDYRGQELVKRYKDVKSINLLNIATKDYFKTAILGDSYFGPVGYENDKAYMRLASQIENQSQTKVLGVITAIIDLSPLQESISQVTLGKEGFVYVLDNNSRVVSSSGKTRQIGDNLVDENKYIQAVLGGGKFSGLEEFVTFKSNKGQINVFAGRPMQKKNWFILSEWPERDAFSVIDNVLMVSILIALITLIAVIILGLFFSRQIIYPINILSNGAKEISKGNLDHKIELKTNDEFELLRDQFNEMAKILKENQELRDEFVFIAAHELRTPVTAIRGYLEMILDGSFGEILPNVSKYLHIINTSNDRLVQLVHDLLQVARSEAGKMKIKVEPVLINNNINCIINELGSLTQEKGINIIYKEQDHKKDVVMADGQKLNEVLINLIGNAVKYTMKKGDIEISHEKKTNYLITHIKDHGMGMSKEEQKSLFTKFYRVQNQETSKIEGTGLGLFISKIIIERMSGKIWVKSKKGDGSIFSFKLKNG